MTEEEKKKDKDQRVTTVSEFLRHALRGPNSINPNNRKVYELEEAKKKKK